MINPEYHQHAVNQCDIKITANSFINVEIDTVKITVQCVMMRQIVHPCNTKTIVSISFMK